ncbi:MAG: hypothetical protein EBT03_09940 [Betaproteobacteria bacterium]|nr:hypothetical protein [Betaproteobacteria bacterium]
MSLEIFSKQFEDEYNLSRELALLADLAQRSAPVPRVLSSDYRQLTVTMEHKGQSLDHWFTSLRSEEICTALSRSIQAFDQVARHGVFHLDIAARNVLFESPRSHTAQVIDFNAALCPRFPLQKPLWLLANPVTHHPDIAAAIERDWSNFFESVGLEPPPSYERAFDIPWERYQTYWPGNVAANEVGQPWVALAFGLGGLLLEALPFLDKGASDQVRPMAQKLRSVDSDTQAQVCIAEAARVLAPHAATPVPRALSLGRSEGLSGRPPSPKGNTPRRSVLRRILHTLGGGLALAGLWLTDFVYSSRAAILGDWAFYSAIVATLLVFFLLLALILRGGKVLRSTLLLALLVAQAVFVRDLWPQVGPLFAVVTLMPVLIATLTEFAAQRAGATLHEMP